MAQARSIGIAAVWRVAMLNGSTAASAFTGRANAMDGVTFIRYRATAATSNAYTR
ncbi:MAG: hypothetical protein IPL01_24640 [Acidobacteria bacterium]|nr:hypothetical protein [Acidobacteriota bacterium]